MATAKTNRVAIVINCNCVKLKYNVQNFNKTINRVRTIIDINYSLMQDENVISRMTAHINLYDRALTIIKRKGFELFLYPNNIDDSNVGTYFAKKDNRDFSAEDPLRLLGMITIWEVQGDDWWDKPNYPSERIDDELMNESYPDSVEDYEAFDNEKYMAFVQKCQSFWSMGMFSDIKIKSNISRKELFEIISNLGKEEDE